MALIIEWTAEAERQLDDILDYLEINWTEKEIRNFIEKLQSGIETISERPKQQKISLRKPNTREYQIVPQVTLFYQHDEKVVSIMLLWSNRMNPDNL